MKKLRLFRQIICMSLVIILLSGCSLVYINKQSLEETVDSILNQDTNLKTVSFDGFSYYLPQEVNLKSSNNSNSILYYNHNKMYLYVDLVSYYHKIENTYKENKNAYYSRLIDNKGKSGYIEITKVNNKLFVEFMYNYSKIESYTTENDLKKTLTVMAYILNSIRYKDSILDSLVGEASINYKEEKFNIFKANGNDTNDYLDYVEQYDSDRIKAKNEDILEIENSLE